MAFERLKNFIAPPENEDGYDEHESNESSEVEEITYRESDVKPVSTYESRKTNVETIPNNAQMVLFEPRSFEEAEEIAVHLKNRRACVVNLHRLQREYSQRTIDFLTGVVYALDGRIEKVGHNLILCSPANMKVSGSIDLNRDTD